MLFIFSFELISEQNVKIQNIELNIDHTLILKMNFKTKETKQETVFIKLS